MNLSTTLDHWVTQVVLSLNVQTLSETYSVLKRKCQLVSTTYKLCHKEVARGNIAVRAQRAKAHREMQALKPALRLVSAMRNQQMHEDETRLPFKELPLLLLGQAGLTGGYSLQTRSPLVHAKGRKRYGCAPDQGLQLIDFLSESLPTVFPHYDPIKELTTQKRERLQSDTEVALVLAKIIKSQLLSKAELDTLQGALK